MRHFREAGKDGGTGKAEMELNEEQEEEFWGSRWAEERRDRRTKERDGLRHWADKHTFIWKEADFQLPSIKNFHKLFVFLPPLHVVKDLTLILQSFYVFL